MLNTDEFLIRKPNSIKFLLPIKCYGANKLKKNDSRWFQKIQTRIGEQNFTIIITKYILNFLIIKIILQKVKIKRKPTPKRASSSSEPNWWCSFSPLKSQSTTQKPRVNTYRKGHDSSHQTLLVGAHQWPTENDLKSTTLHSRPRTPGPPPSPSPFPTFVR